MNNIENESEHLKLLIGPIECYLIKVINVVKFSILFHYIFW